jgi:hypothetical protein
MPSLSWIFCLTLSMLSEGSTMISIVLPVSVLMKIFMISRRKNAISDDMKIKAGISGPRA